jgi:serine/threonine protein kinase/tetratricopeptide (TPR) repeat protein
MTEPSIPLGPFRLARRIGRGGMAEVWNGVHAVQGVPVAVKVMTGQRSREAQYRAAFRNEIQSVASLDHPGVVLVFDHGEVGPEAEDASRGLLPAGSPFLAMELADGDTLAERFPDGPSWSELRAVLLSLLDALAHAHARGVIHRDLKPSNVLVFSDPRGGALRLKLADFGLAHAFELSARPDSTQVVCGTPSFMAPEQLRGEWRDFGPWTDLYSLGCMAWSLASGRPPFEGNLLDLVRYQLQESPSGFEPRRPAPPGFEGWLRRLLEKEPGDRFVRAADAARALLALKEPVSGPAAGASVRQPLEVDPHSTLLTLSILLPPGAVGPPLPPPPQQPGAEPPSPLGAPPLPASWEDASVRPPSPQLLGAGLGLWGLRSIPLIGRHGERGLLWRALAEVHARRRPAAAVMVGAAGNGKTRLAQWLAERAHEVGGATVLRAAHSPDPGPADGLSRMLARHLRCVGLSRGEVLARTGHLLQAEGVSEESEWIGLADLMASGVLEEETEGPAARPQSARERFELLERHFRRLAAERPVLVLLDDIQWGSEAIAFTRYLLDRGAEVPLPVLLVLTARGEALAERPLEAAALADLLQAEGAFEIEVPPLPAEERTALVRELLGLAGDLAASVEQRTGGNPLFAVQLVGDWVQRGLLEAGSAGFVLRPGATVWLPDDLHQVWSDRVARLLEKLPAGTRQVLEIAATLGNAVDLRELEGACQTAGLTVPAELAEQLVANRLAVRTEEGWAFVHAMLRESVERLADEAGRWPAHHHSCAALLAVRERAGDRGVAERLGRHLLQAGEHDAALAPLLRGARERRERSDYRGARALLDQRDEILDQLGAPVHDARRGEGWVLRARIHLHQGRLGEVFHWAERTEAAAAGPGWTEIRAEAVRLRGDAARRRGDLGGAAALYESCVALGEETNGAAASLWGLGDLARQKGDLNRARELFDRSRHLYDARGDHHGVADYLIGLADLSRHAGELETAQGLYLEAEVRFEELGNQYGVSRGLNGLGEIARLRGDLVRADRLYHRAESILTAVRSADGLFPRFNQALVALAQKDFPRAGGILEDCREMVEALGWGGLLGCIHLARLSCLAQTRAWSTWDDAFGLGALAVRSAGLVDPDVAGAAELAWRTAEAAGQPARARAAWELALEQYRRLGDALGARRAGGS